MGAGFAQSPDILPCPFMGESPKLDGKIGKAEWFDAASFTGVIRLYPEPKGEYIREKIQYFLGHTSTHLWIGFRVYRNTRPRTSTPGGGQNSSRVWQDDAVEIMLDVKNAQKNALNLALNAKSDYADFKISPPLKDKWNLKWDYRASLTALGWEGEIAIPWKKLETTEPEEGELWRFDLILNRKTPAQLIARVGDHPKGKWTSMEFRPFLRFTKKGAVPHIAREGDLWRIEAVNPAGKQVKAELETTLFRRKVPGAFRLERFEKDFPQILQKKSSLYAEKKRNVKIAPFRKAVLTIDKEIEPGHYLQELKVRDEKGTILYSQQFPFFKEPPLFCHVIHAFLEGKKSSIEADFPLLAKKAENGKITFTLSVNGKICLKKEKKVTSSHAVMVLPHPANLKAGAEIRITTRLFDPKGKLLAENRSDAAIPPAPAWLKEVPSISCSKVPYPWEELRFSRNTLSMSKRSYHFAGHTLPRKIRAAGKELFAAPPVLEGVLENGKKILLDFPGRFLSCNGKNAIFSGEKQLEGIQFRYSSKTEFDGFIWNDLSLDCAGKTFRELKLVFRFPKERILYFGHSYKGTAPFRTSDYGNWGQLPGKGLSLPFVYCLWLGDQERGITLALESDQYWNSSQKNGAITVKNKGKVTELVIHFLKNNQKKKEKLAFSFGLHPTPVKPYNHRNHTDGIFTLDVAFQKKDPRGLAAWKKSNLGRLASNGGNFGILWSKGDERFGHPFPNQIVGENLRSIAETGKEKKEKYFYYCGWAGNAKTPEVESYQEEMARMPKAEWGAADLFKQCPAGAWSNMYLAGVKLLVEKYGLYGVYMDQTTELSSCSNPAHSCGYIGEDGKVRPTFPVRKMRYFYMRLYLLLLEKLGKENFMIYSHNSTQPVFTPVDAFISRRCALEILAKEMDHKKISSPERIAGGFNPVATGVPVEATWWNGFHPTMYNNELMASLWLFGCTLKGVQWKMDSSFREGYGKKEHAELGVMRALRSLSSQRLIFIPYWQKKSYKTKFLSSCWINKEQKKMLLILSNLTGKNRKEKVLFPGKITAEDCVNGKTIVKDALSFSLAIPAKSYRALLLEYK